MIQQKKSSYRLLNKHIERRLNENNYYKLVLKAAQLSKVNLRI